MNQSQLFFIQALLEVVGILFFNDADSNHTGSTTELKHLRWPISRRRV